MEKIEDILKNQQKKSAIIKREINWDEQAKLIFQIAKTFEPGYLVNEYNKDILKQLLLYFTGNQDFNGNLHKGIMLVGGVGTGKSLIFKIFKTYTGYFRTNSYQSATAIDIIDNVNTFGTKYLDEFSHRFEKNTNKVHPITYYIDDIASKNENIKHYGTDIKVIEQLLSLRYNVFEKYGTLTHVSTNILPSKMKDIYENRIISRMNEMFNIIEIKGRDYRRIF